MLFIKELFSYLAPGLFHGNFMVFVSQLKCTRKLNVPIKHCILYIQINTVLLWLRVFWWCSLSLYCNFRNRPLEAKLFKWRVKLMSTIKVAPFIFTTHSAAKGHLIYKHIQGLKWSYKLCLCEYVLCMCVGLNLTFLSDPTGGKICCLFRWLMSFFPFKYTHE